MPRVTASAVDAAASSSDIDAGVRALAHDGAPVFTIDADELVSLAPTVILTQSLCEVCAVSDGDVRSVAEVLSPAPQVISLGATTLAGVWHDIATVGDAVGRREAAVELVASIAARLLRVHNTLKTARAPRPRVAVIEWLDPLFAAGHWTPDLVRCAGGIDVLCEPGAHSVVMSLDQLRAATPGVLLFAPCGFDVGRAGREANALLARPEWAWAQACECWSLDGNALTSRPGPRLADAVDTMAAIFAPTLFGAPPPEYASRLR